jgi:leucyl/phenylalanyl-tRNA--protein transferase
MADARGEIGWYLPKRRAIFLPGDAHTSRSVARLLRRGRFEVVFDRDFPAVIRACADHSETWISGDILRTYEALHELGLAHSVEAYEDGRLAGGLYGVALGGAFFGESMFHRVTDASKVAFAILCGRLDEQGFKLHDAQFLTPHLAALGVREVPNGVYLRLLAEALCLRCSLV